MQVGLFFFGVSVGIAFVVFGQAAIDGSTASECAQKHNVYACERVVTWAPKDQTN